MEALSFGTSSIGSSIYTMAVGMGDIINKKIGINVAVEPVGGSDANVNALADKKVDIGILNSYAGVSGFQGVGNFAKRGEVPLRILVQEYSPACCARCFWNQDISRFKRKDGYW